MQRGSIRTLRDDGHAPEQESVALPEPPPNEGAVAHDGFNLRASVAIAADDDLGRERLCRQGARPPPARARPLAAGSRSHRAAQQPRRGSLTGGAGRAELIRWWTPTTALHGVTLVHVPPWLYETSPNGRSGTSAAPPCSLRPAAPSLQALSAYVASRSRSVCRSESATTSERSRSRFRSSSR